ncbi:MAG: fluoride efflux transporter CrcB [Bacteroidetes bacterium]|nr:fluoride efflux transporter CrcB [Bacteroidota bacterium]MCZ2133776.1 fluoride efflux transporter CrcB [Bacteroidota bacterium]
MWLNLLLVGAGGFLGSAVRYALGIMLLKIIPYGFPAGTFAANIAGCFLIGVFYGCADRFSWFAPELRIFLTAGFCGGFTTFSSFSYENFKLLESEQYLTFTLYSCGSFIFGLLAVIAGITLLKR